MRNATPGAGLVSAESPNLGRPAIEMTVATAIARILLGEPRNHSVACVQYTSPPEHIHAIRQTTPSTESATTPSMGRSLRILYALDDISVVMSAGTSAIAASTRRPSIRNLIPRRIATTIANA